MDRRGFYSVLTALVQGSIWLIPLASVSPTTPQPMTGVQTQKQQVQSHQASHCHEDKGLLSFLSFQPPSPHPHLLCVHNMTCPGPEGWIGVSQVPGER